MCCSLSKGTQTWIHLPPEAWEHAPPPVRQWYDKNKHKFQHPVFRLRKALYGHPDSGTYWEQHCDEALKTVGFHPIPQWNSCYHHKEWGLFLIVYVDDFKLSGNKDHIEDGWNAIRKLLDIEPPKDAHLFLGCIHEKKTVTLSSGENVNCILWDMEDYLASSVQAYCDLVRKHFGEEVKLTQVPTSFLPEDHRESPAGNPAHDCPLCGRCMHAAPAVSEPDHPSQTDNDTICTDPRLSPASQLDENMASLSEPDAAAARLHAVPPQVILPLKQQTKEPCPGDDKKPQAKRAPTKKKKAAKTPKQPLKRRTRADCNR